ncbi:hypothetical protein MATL_G00172250 [Megalops atlanticus]|uniref:Uncharacterized protein n=1 Tax=Megalops atlanticus TaxID=7932 RepID=A0A9D3PP41_MEGAT|nr:hypothetical protein MATL_G00172250 [Megalops atlanticus]
MHSLQSKAPPINHLSLLQDLSACVWRAALLQFHYAAGKKNPKKKKKTRVSWYVMGFQCMVTVFVWLFNAAPHTVWAAAFSFGGSKGI